MAEKNYALYNKTTALIENIVHWDEELNPHISWPDGYAVVAIPDNVESTWLGCGIGWSYINGQFVEPPKPEPPEPEPPEPDNK